MAITNRDTVDSLLRAAILNPEHQARALAFRQLKLREELSGVGLDLEPIPELNRYLVGELTLSELVDLRLRPELCE